MAVGFCGVLLRYNFTTIRIHTLPWRWLEFCHLYRSRVSLCLCPQRISAVYIQLPRKCLCVTPPSHQHSVTIHPFSDSRTNVAHCYKRHLLSVHLCSFVWYYRQHLVLLDVHARYFVLASNWHPIPAHDNAPNHQADKLLCRFAPILWIALSQS